MLPSRVYRAESIVIAKRAFIAALILTAVLSVCSVATIVPGMRGLLRSQSTLHRLNADLAGLQNQAATESGIGAKLPGVITGGIDRFALQVAQWTSARRIRMESLVPETTPVQINATVDGESVGKWKANKVTLQGRGRFEQVMGMLDDFRTTRLPVQLGSFTLQALNGGEDGMVEFLMTVTVYEECKAG